MTRFRALRLHPGQGNKCDQQDMVYVCSPGNSQMLLVLTGIVRVVSDYASGLEAEVSSKQGIGGNAGSQI